MSERELSELILSVELGGRVRVDCPGVASYKELSTCSAYAGCENNLKIFHSQVLISHCAPPPATYQTVHVDSLL